jgi:hypothetical protein
LTRRVRPGSAAWARAVDARAVPLHSIARVLGGEINSPRQSDSDGARVSRSGKEACPQLVVVTVIVLELPLVPGAS